MVPKKVWHPEDIKAEVRKRGVTLTQLAIQNDCEASVCRAALRRPSPRGEQIISAFLDVPPQQLWPQRYAKNGARRAPRHIRDENSRTREAAHRQIREAV